MVGSGMILMNWTAVGNELIVFRNGGFWGTVCNIGMENSGMKETEKEESPKTQGMRNKGIWEGSS
jgi:hypothetical protein